MKWFPVEACPAHEISYFQCFESAGRHYWDYHLETSDYPCTKCRETYFRTAREPGRFKYEYYSNELGTILYALASKTHIFFKSQSKEKKLTCKGVQKDLNDLVHNNFCRVLNDQKGCEVINKGFRVHDGQMYSYTTRKQGLGYLYIKRKVSADGVHTTPLDV
jgi:hypothetical protein